MRYILIAGMFSLLLLQGCTTAGPFVTSISSDGRGGILIEKCHVHMNAFMGTISNADCVSQQINVQSNKPD
jgi:type IV secretion system protein VirB7